MKRRLLILILLPAILFVGSCGSSSGGNPQQTLAALVTLSKIMDIIDPRGALTEELQRYTVAYAAGLLSCWSAPILPKKVPDEPGTDIIGIGQIVKFMDNTTLKRVDNNFPEGQGSFGFTVFGGTSPLQRGSFMLAYLATDGNIPVNNDTRYYQYAVVADLDGNPGNNFVNLSFPDDYFTNSDWWLMLQKQPGNPWSLTAVDASGPTPTQISTLARAIICGNGLLFIVPMSELGTPFVPPVRLTSFCHGGDFGNPSLDWSGTNRPREPLLKQMTTNQYVSSSRLIEIEARFLTVDDNFLNDIGIDFNLDLNFDQALTNPPQQTNSEHNGDVAVNTSIAGGKVGGMVLVPQTADFSSLFPIAFPIGGVQPDATVFTGFPVGGPFRMDDETYWEPQTENGANFDTPSVPSLSPTIDSFQSTFLTDTELNVILQAHAARTDLKLLVTPRITVRDGQEATIQVLNERNDVSNLIPEFLNVVSSNNPTIQEVTSGITLNFIANIPVGGPVPGPGVQINLRQGSHSIAAVLSELIQLKDVEHHVALPFLSRGTAETRVLVQDGQTLAIGGLIQTGNSTSERITVPLLGDIPYVSRLFQNEAKISDTEEVVILLTPRIIRQSEQE